jgi:hypothetical protein
MRDLTVVSQRSLQLPHLGPENELAMSEYIANAAVNGRLQMFVLTL